MTLFVGCSASPEHDAAGDPAQGAPVASAESPLLAPGTVETLVDGIASAENSMFTSTDRLFISGDDGIYEVTRSGSTASKTLLTASSGCKFSGLSEAPGGTVYAGCYDGTNSKVFAAPLNAAPAFKAIYDLPGVALANGVAADAGHHVYVADSTHGDILRLTVDAANPFSVTRSETFSSGNLFPNGLKVFDSSLYFTDFFSVKRLAVGADGTAGTITTLNSQLTFLDDLYVDASSIYVANYLFGTLELLTPGGYDVFDTAAILKGPSSVVPAKGRLGLTNLDVIVTEKSANRVSVFHAR